MNKNDNKLTLEYLKEISQNQIKIKSMKAFKNLFKNKDVVLFPCKEEEFKRESEGVLFFGCYFLSLICKSSHYQI